MQSFGQEWYIYDGNAYTIASTSYSGTGTLQMFTMHPTKPVELAGRPQYHMNQLTAFAMAANLDSCRDGVRAYKNGQDLVKEYRDAAIARANETANAKYEEAPVTTPADPYRVSFTSGSPVSTQN